jgi:hypothetical protein
VNTVINVHVALIAEKLSSVYTTDGLSSRA